MPTIYSILDTGRRGLTTNQLSINTVSHNIANVNTEGYSKQQAILETTDPFRTHRGQIGTGVGIQTVDRANTKYIQRQLLDRIPATEYYSTSHDRLSMVEAHFSDSDGEDIQTRMVSFFDSFNQLAQRPDDMSLREDVRRKAELVVDAFNNTDGAMEKMQIDMNAELDGITREVNTLSRKISSLNRDIAVEEAAGHEANDFRDRQEQAVRDLSELIDVDCFTDSKGFPNVWMDSGEPLVSGKQSYDMVTIDRSDGMKEIAVDRDGALVNVTGDLRGGELAALIDVRDSSIGSYRGRLDELARTFATEVNTVHAAGYGLDLLQRDFFERVDATEPFSASNIRIHGDITASLDAIAAAQSNDADEVYGDNRNAMAIAALIEDDTFFGTGETFADHYQSTVGTIGHDTSESASDMELSAAKQESLLNFRESVAGVNVDEELIDLNKFKKAYEASSRIINTADEMIDTILGLKR